MEVNEERLKRNYGAVRSAAGARTEVLAVVKANAYGHGAARCATALAQAGARWLGVADVAEGVSLRRALNQGGFPDAKILVMCGLTAEDVADVVQHRLTPVIWTVEQVQLLAEHPGTRVHVEVDSGMGRQGCRPGSKLDAVLDAVAESRLELDGLMTHFCAAEVVGSEKTREQKLAFEAAVERVRERGIQVAWVHAGASSTVDDPTWNARWLEAQGTMIGAQAMLRCGIALYGYCNPLVGAEESAARLRSKLLPVMTWKTRVLDVRDVAAGESIGYNATFTAKEPMRVALLPAGYADGLRRELGGTNERAGGWVMVRGQRANIVGRVSMNLTTVDVSGIDGLQVGDEVVVLGDGVTADDHARVAQTISYEILCGAGKASC